jgi:hypothetical protein
MSPLAIADVLGRQVAVYRNLRTGGYSVKATVSGPVLGVVPAIALADVRFHIQPGGQRRCRETGVRGVHAYVLGTVVALEHGATCDRRLTYHFSQPTFSLKDTGKPLEAVPLCRLDGAGAWVQLAKAA